MTVCASGGELVWHHLGIQVVEFLHNLVKEFDTGKIHPHGYSIEARRYEGINLI